MLREHLTADPELVGNTDSLRMHLFDVAMLGTNNERVVRVVRDGHSADVLLQSAGARFKLALGFRATSEILSVRMERCLEWKACGEVWGRHL